VHELVIIETGHIDARFKHEVLTYLLHGAESFLRSLLALT